MADGHRVQKGAAALLILGGFVVVRMMVQPLLLRASLFQLVFAYIFAGVPVVCLALLIAGYRGRAGFILAAAAMLLSYAAGSHDIYMMLGQLTRLPSALSAGDSSSTVRAAGAQTATTAPKSGSRVTAPIPVSSPSSELTTEAVEAHTALVKWKAADAVSTSCDPGAPAGKPRYPPQPLRILMPPLPVPEGILGKRFRARFDVDCTGQVLGVSFNSTGDEAYDSKMLLLLRVMRFKPGYDSDGHAAPRSTEIGYDF